MFCCATLTLLTDVWLANLRGGVRRNTLKLYGFYVIKVTFAVSIINVPFKAYRCLPCGQFIKLNHHLEWLLIVCKERFKHFFPKNVYQLQETSVDKLDSFNSPYSDDHNLFRNLAIFNFESCCVSKTNSALRVLQLGSASTSSIIEKSNFLCKSNPRALIESFLMPLMG